MPKGRVLSASERTEIGKLHAAGASGREIAKKLQRSKSVVLKFLKSPAQYGQIKRSGRKRALSGDEEQRLYRALFHPQTTADETKTDQVEPSEGSGAPSAVPLGKMSAEQIKREFNVPLSVRRIQQLLSEWRTMARREQDARKQCEPSVSGSPCPEEAVAVVQDDMLTGTIAI